MYSHSIIHDDDDDDNREIQSATFLYLNVSFWLASIYWHVLIHTINSINKYLKLNVLKCTKR